MQPTACFQRSSSRAKGVRWGGRPCPCKAVGRQSRERAERDARRLKEPVLRDGAPARVTGPWDSGAERVLVEASPAVDALGSEGLRGAAGPSGTRWPSPPLQPRAPPGLPGAAPVAGGRPRPAGTAGAPSAAPPTLAWIPGAPGRASLGRTCLRPTDPRSHPFPRPAPDTWPSLTDSFTHSLGRYGVCLPWGDPGVAPADRGPLTGMGRGDGALSSVRRQHCSLWGLSAPAVTPPPPLQARGAPSPVQSLPGPGPGLVLEAPSP